jgi:hypothetical protein
MFRTSKRQRVDALRYCRYAMKKITYGSQWMISFRASLWALKSKNRRIRLAAQEIFE